MIKRLRVKFVCITMALLMIMLLVIFGLVYQFTARGLESDSLSDLQSATAEMPGRPGKTAQPVFTLQEGPHGELMAFGSDYYDLQDEQWIREVFQTAREQGDPKGILPGYSLRYFRSSNPVGVSVAFMDITAEQEMLQTLIRNCVFIGIAAFLGFLVISILLARWMVKPVEKAWQQQRQFVADASHELKTPLTVILTNAELLQTGQCGEEEKSRLSDNILAMSRRMRGLVEDLLQLARGDNGKTLGQMEPVDVSTVTQEALLMFEPVYFEEGLQLESQVEDGLRVMGSALHLRQVLEILLDNGRKYSAPGSTCLLTLSRQGRKLQLRFFSPGEPLTQEQCRDIFKRFYRVDEARTGGSYGLGLSIAQRIVEEHRGRIWAEPKTLGNAFVVTLPEL